MDHHTGAGLTVAAAAATTTRLTWLQQRAGRNLTAKALVDAGRSGTVSTLRSERRKVLLRPGQTGHSKHALPYGHIVRSEHRIASGATERRKVLLTAGVYPLGGVLRHHAKISHKRVKLPLVVVTTRVATSSTSSASSLTCPSPSPTTATTSGATSCPWPTGTFPMPRRVRKLQLQRPRLLVRQLVHRLAVGGSAMSAQVNLGPEHRRKLFLLAFALLAQVVLLPEVVPQRVVVPVGRRGN